MLTNSLDTRSGHEIWLKDCVDCGGRYAKTSEWVMCGFKECAWPWCDSDTLQFPILHGDQQPSFFNPDWFHTSVDHSYVSHYNILVQ
jgi:hypothetical protein